MIYYTIGEITSTRDSVSVMFDACIIPEDITTYGSAQSSESSQQHTTEEMPPPPPIPSDATYALVGFFEVTIRSNK